MPLLTSTGCEASKLSLISPPTCIITVSHNVNPYSTESTAKGTPPPTTTAGIRADAEVATVGIGAETEVATVGTWAKIEGIAALLLQNEGTGALALIAVHLIEPKENKIEENSKNDEHTPHKNGINGRKDYLLRGEPV